MDSKIKSKGKIDGSKAAIDKQDNMIEEGDDASPEEREEVRDTTEGEVRNKTDKREAKIDFADTFSEYATKGYLAGVEHCLQKGVDVNKKYYDGLTALHMSAYEGHHRVVKFLLASGADPHAVDDHGVTTLMQASRCNAENTQVMNLLIEAGVCLNSQSDILQKNALHYACDTSYRSSENVQLLLQAGVDANVKDKCGNLPVSYAEEKECHAIVECLNDWNAPKKKDAPCEEDVPIAAADEVLRDTFVVGIGGGQLVSTEDKEIKVDVAKDTFPSGAEFSLGVKHIGEDAVTNVKENNKDLTSLRAVGKEVKVKMSTKPESKIRFQSPIPKIKGSRKRVKAARRIQKKTHQQPVKYRPMTSREKTRIEKEDVDFLHLLIRSISGNWQARPDIPVDCYDQETASFESADEMRGFQFLLTDNTVKTSAVPDIVKEVDKMRDSHVVNFVFLQKSHNLTRAYIDCVRKSAVQDLLVQCRNAGYDEQSMPSADILLKENQEVRIRLNGDVSILDHDPEFMRFQFNPVLDSARRELKLLCRHSHWQNQQKKVYLGCLEFHSVQHHQAEAAATNPSLLYRFSIEIPEESTRPPAHTQGEMRALLKRAFRIVISNSHAIRQWRMLGRALEVPEADLEDVNADVLRGPSEKCLAVLHMWHNQQGSGATVGALADVLRQERMVKVAEDIEEL